MQRLMQPKAKQIMKNKMESVHQLYIAVTEARRTITITKRRNEIALSITYHNTNPFYHEKQRINEEKRRCLYKRIFLLLLRKR